MSRSVSVSIEENTKDFYANELHFMHSEIESKFSNDSEINATARMLTERLKTNPLSMVFNSLEEYFPLGIYFCKDNGRWYCKDNERLYLFRVLQMNGSYNEKLETNMAGIIPKPLRPVGCHVAFKRSTGINVLPHCNCDLKPSRFSFCKYL